MAAKKTKSRKPANGSNKLRPDVNEVAFRVVQEATGQAQKSLPPEEREEKNPEAVARGRKGGQKGGPKGGKSRARKLTDEEREAAAQVAALARWRKK